MFDIYWGDDCFGSGFEVLSDAVSAAHRAIERSNRKILAVGRADNDLWCIVQSYDENGFFEYECISIRKKCK